jgi:murein DD-endopeptidase MepM/ murein hydrolase activator NlpD
MQKLRPLFKKLSTTVTIMLVPHSRGGSLNFRMPYALLGLLLVFAGVGAIYTVSLTYHALGFYVMKQKYARMSGQLQEMKSAINSIKESESEFKRIFSKGSRKKVLDAMDAPRDDGSINIEELKLQIGESIATVSEIKGYLAKERDVYRATPQGIPVDGRFSSGFGMRVHPRTGRMQLHTGMDLSAQSGTPVYATADGVVSFSGWSRGNGNIVVIEHGHGFSTVYAHNSRNLAKVGQTVRRGQQISTAGSTGVSTGPHVHYEVWKNGKCVNPESFTKAVSG